MARDQNSRLRGLVQRRLPSANRANRQRVFVFLFSDQSRSDARPANQTAALFVQSLNSDVGHWNIVDVKQPAIYAEAIMFVDLINQSETPVKGYRLRVSASYDMANWDGASDPGPYTLSTVEARVLCHANQPPHQDGSGCVGA